MKTKRWDIQDYLKTSDDIADYLEASLEEDDYAFLKIAVNNAITALRKKERKDDNASHHPSLES